MKIKIIKLAQWLWDKLQSLRKHELEDDGCPSEHWLFGGEEK